MAQPPLTVHFHSSNMTVVTPHPLTNLPPEIMLLISERLTAEEMVRLSRTCRSLNHFGGCKSIVKAFMRSGTADAAILSLRAKVNRMDVIVELFRHVENRKASYPDVAFVAARLNDLKQLESWSTEVGFIPSSALCGAARSDRNETFDAIFPRVVLNDRNAENVFESIGEVDNRALLDHLRTNYPELVTPELLQKVVLASAYKGNFEFALGVFEGMSPRCGKVIHNCAGRIAIGAAEHGNSVLFTEFIDKFQYCDEIRNYIASSAASNGHIEFMRMQEQTENSAISFGDALEFAVENSAFEAVQLILDDDDFVTNRLTGYDLEESLRWAIKYRQRPEMLPLILPRVPRKSLLREASVSNSLDAAKTILGGYRLSDKIRAYPDHLVIEIAAYSDDIPDWKMTVWLVILGLDAHARAAKSNIDEAERARYLSILPAAIDLAVELVLGESLMEMTQFVQGSLE